MRYQTFDKEVQSTYPTAILSPTLDHERMLVEYLDELPVDPKSVIAYELATEGKKTPATVQRDCLKDLTEDLMELGTKHILVTNADYFKTFAGVTKAEHYLGYAMPNKYPAEHAGEFTIFYCPNFRQVFHNPAPTRAKIKQALDALWSHTHGYYREPGNDIIQFAEYPDTVEAIEAWLQNLIKADRPLTCDIEGFGLKHYECGIGTISFAWTKHEGIAFPVDYGLSPEDAKRVRKALAKFFIEFKNKIIFHNASFDVMVLIYQLYMEHLIDTEGLLRGLGIMLKNFDDTKIIAYLATNSCAGNDLGLKDQAQEFAGNYAVEDIKDITKVPLDKLLEYNLVDSLSTWFVHEKHWDTMVADNQLELYEDLFKPALIDIIQMQLTGMPVDMDAVKEAEKLIKKDRQDAMDRIYALPLVQDFNHQLNLDAVHKFNTTRKVKRITLDDVDEQLNLNSAPQLQRLLYEMLNLPIIEKTKSKKPATGGDVLGKLRAYTEDPDTLEFLNALVDYKAVDKIYSSFIPPLLAAPKGPDGWHYLFGNFNLGGTVSGRLSSSGPNLQNLPSNGKYAKIIKACFKAPPGWLFIGLDFASLEDRISALTTKDPQKLKVYTDGYDGHCLRAHSYFGEEMPDIDATSVDSINSIAKKYKGLRQDSKGPTFLLTYQGTWIGIVGQFGFTKERAQQIESRYHVLYAESDKWVQARLDEAAETGYVEAAFGLRVRTPLLKQVIRGTNKTPYEAEKEGRTAGNALGQSWCLLNSRASVEFLRKARTSEFRTKIRPTAHIHDAQYFMIPDDMDTLLYVNEHLVEAVEWQDHPAIEHDEVKLGGEVSVFWPTWAEEAVVPNGATREDVLSVIQEHVLELEEKEAA